MPSDPNDIAGELIKHCNNSLVSALDATLCVIATLNELVRKPQEGGESLRDLCRLVIEEIRGAASVSSHSRTALSKPAVSAILRWLASTQHLLWEPRRNNPHRQSVYLFKPVDVMPAVLTMFTPHGRHMDIEYHTFRWLARRHGIRYTAFVVEALRNMSTEVNALRMESSAKQRQVSTPRSKLLARLRHVTRNVDTPESIASFFMDLAEMQGVIALDWRHRSSVLLRGACDPDYLLCRSFGLKTAIAGFDEIFNGGLLMAQSTSPDSSIGRTIIVRGACGSGKTLLASQLAFEVASKGGVAFVFALDQERADLNKQYRSFGWLPGNGNFRYADSADQFLVALADRGRREKGLFGVGNVSKCSLETHFDSIRSLIEVPGFSEFPLNLIVVDPVNSVVLPNGANPQSLRNATNDFFQYLKQRGVAAVFTTEQESDPQRQFHHEENIADVVIKLWNEESERQQYSQRFLEILKSRGQPTHRGRQPFAIKKGTGIVIYPSSAAVMAERSERRTFPPSSQRTSCGIEDLDRILCNLALRVSMHRPTREHGAELRANIGFREREVITLRGTSGCGKTEIALVFALTQNCPVGPRPLRRPKALYVTFRDSDESVRSLILEGAVNTMLSRRPWRQRGTGAVTQLQRLITLSFEGGFLRPGEVLQKIIGAFRTARAAGSVIEKVVIDNVKYMQESCPLIAADTTFVPTLMRVLRTENCTTMFVCTGDDHPVSEMSREIADSSDCVIDFRRVFFRGQNLTAVHVAKTRSMEHDPRVYEIVLDKREGIRITQQFALFRNVMSGRPDPLPLRLFLHAETASQARYNSEISATLGHTLGTTVDVSAQDLLTSLRVADIAPAAGVDELQIVQVDEYQVRAAGNSWLQRFPVSQMPRLLESYSKSTLSCCTDGKEFWAVPYYGNVSLLAYDKSKMTLQPNASWRDIASVCRGRPNTLVFDFTKDSDETINSFFLEMLAEELWLQRGKRQPFHGMCLGDILSAPVCRRVAKRFWRIGHKAYQAQPPEIGRVESRLSGNSTAPFATCSPDALIWRHWYTTLIQMLGDIGADRRSNIRVRPLPGNFSVTGEWFLGVTRMSSGRDVGVKVVDTLTSYDAAQERVERAVAFPVRKEFFAGQIDRFPSSLFQLEYGDLSSLCKNAIRRSSFACYFEATKTLTFFLRTLLCLPDSPELDTRIKEIVSLMARKVSNICNVSGRCRKKISS